MTFKRMLFLGSVLGGAALLRDKARRERLIGSARGWFQNARGRSEATSVEASPEPAETVLPPIRDFGPPYTPPAGV